MSTCWPSDVCTGHQCKATIEFVVLCISPDDPSSSLWVQHAGKRRSFRRLLVLESVCGEDTFAGKVDVGSDQRFTLMFLCIFRFPLSICLETERDSAVW